MAKSDFEHLGHLINDLIRSYGLEKKVQEYEVMARWEEIVGEKIARRTQPLRISSGKLFVQTKNAAWRNELFLLKPRIIEKINSSLGRELVKDIILV